MIVFLTFQVDSEKKEPHSQTRIASGKIPHMWGQSLYVLARLLIEVGLAAFFLFFLQIFGLFSTCQLWPSCKHIICVDFSQMRNFHNNCICQ